MNQQPQPKRRKAMVKRQQQINCTSREISEAILQQDTKQLDAVAPRRISNSRQASDDEAGGLQFESNDAYGEASLVGDPSCFKKKPPRSLMLMKKSSQMSLALTQHTSPAMPAYKIQVMKSKILNKTFWMISSSTIDLPPNGNSMMDFSTSSYSTTDLWMRKFDSGSFSQSGLPPRVYLDLQLTYF